MCWRSFVSIKPIAVLLSIVALGTAFIIGSAQRGSADCTVTIVGTYVANVSVRVTRSPGHTFYYPSRLRWEWDQVRKRLGFRIKSSSQVLDARPTPPGDVLWVTFTYREKLHDPKMLVAEELNDEGRMRCYHSFGGLLDESRRASVSKWPLVGGVERHRGKVIHVRTMPRGKELATIVLR